MTKTYRPGVYSQYDIISQRRSLQDRYAFYCGAAKVREGKSIPAGGVVQILTRRAARCSVRCAASCWTAGSAASMRCR